MPLTFRSLNHAILAFSLATGTIATRAFADHRSDNQGGGERLQSAVADLAASAASLRAAAEDGFRRHDSRNRGARRAMGALRLLEQRTSELRNGRSYAGTGGEQEDGLARVSEARASVVDLIANLGRDQSVERRFEDFERAFSNYRGAVREAARDRDPWARNGEGGPWARDAREHDGREHEHDARDRDGRSDPGWSRDRHREGPVPQNDPRSVIRVPAGTTIIARTNQEWCAEDIAKSRTSEIPMVLITRLAVNGRELAPVNAEAVATTSTRSPGELALSLRAIRIGSELVAVATRPVRFSLQGDKVRSETRPELEPAELGRTPFRHGASVCLGRAEQMEFTLLEPMTIADPIH